MWRGLALAREEEAWVRSAGCRPDIQQPGTGRREEPVSLPLASPTRHPLLSALLPKLEGALPATHTRASLPEGLLRRG